MENITYQINTNNKRAAKHRSFNITEYQVAELGKCPESNLLNLRHSYAYNIQDSNK